MARSFTPNQQAAIDVRDGSVLVSAAAGSGKTAVLTQRVVDILSDTQNPVSPEKILVVTFTNAAAAEMRRRIFSGLAELIRQDPTNAYLKRQQSMLGFAEICTIDSFCMRLVKEHAALLGLRRDLNIGEAVQMNALARKALGQVLGKFYEEEDPVFLQLSEKFGSGKNDTAFEETIMKLYRFFMSIPSKELWIESMLAQFYAADEFFDTLWGDELYLYAQNFLSWAVSTYKNALNEVQFSENFDKICALLQDDLSQFEKLQTALNTHCYQTFYNALQGVVFSRFPVVRALKDDIQKDRIKALRDRVKEVVQNDMQAKTFLRNDEQHLQDCEALFSLFKKLYEVVCDFVSVYEQTKMDANLYEFSDIEYYALNLLSVQDGDIMRSSPLAEKLKKDYAYILVDEYQDTNQLQDTLFACLSQDNLFMVGDVKQSIYKFRQANPDIFIEKSRAFTPYNGTDYPALIHLEKNFRSSTGVTDFVNYIFTKIMSVDCGDIDYNDDHKLINGGGCSVLEEASSTEIILLDSEEIDDETSADAAVVADKISKMLKDGFLVKDGDSMRPATYSDFAVLLRQGGKTAQVYIDALNDAGIPAEGSAAGAFLYKKEILMITNFLKVIDNPTDDTALAGTLLSPLFGLTSDDLAKVKVKKQPLYLCLQNSSDPLVKNFLQLCDHLRSISYAVSAKDLIDRIYTMTDAKNKVLFLSEGETRVNNLNRLLEIAGNFVGAGTLRGFIGYITSVENAGEDFEPAPVPKQENSVKVLTIHKSKGLEFNVVFVAGLHKRLNISDSTGKVLLSSKLGFSCYRRYDNKSQHTTLIHQAVAKDIARQQKSEELRVLYVALTRAKQKLIIPIVGRRLGKEIAVCQSAGCSPMAISGCGSFKSMILSALCGLSSFENTLHHFQLLPLWDTKADFLVNITLLDSIPNVCAEQKTPEVSNAVDPALVSKYKEAIAPPYPYAALAATPTKIAASGLTGRGEVKFTTRPAFMTSAGLSPTERGNAMHKFMQFCNFASAKADPSGEILRMQSEKYLTEKECSVIKSEAVSAFFEGDMGKLIESAVKVYREYKFFTHGVMDENGMISLKDDQPVPDDDKVLIQGIADCVLDMGDYIIIIDYKTDVVDSMQALAQRYQAQVDLYAAALSELFGKEARKSILYSFYLSKSIEIPAK